MLKLPSISDSKKTKPMDMDKLNEYAKEKASLAKKKREDARATALERLQQEQEKSRASAPKWADARSMEPYRKKPVDANRSTNPSHKEDFTNVDIEDLEENYSLPRIPKHSSTKSKKSTTIDPFEEVQGSVASLLKSVRNKLGGKRTKKARKNHKRTRKATSHKNRRHSAKK
jgi:hypothetical protein